METRVTGVHLRSAKRSVLLECVQTQGILEVTLTMSLPYDSYTTLRRYTGCKNRTELMKSKGFDFEIAGQHSLVIHDRIAGQFSSSYHLPKSCNAWIIKEYQHDRNGVWLTILPTNSSETFEYSISLDEYARLKAIAGIAPDVPLTKGITVKSIGVVGIGNASQLLVTINEKSEVYFESCVLVNDFEVSTRLTE